MFVTQKIFTVLLIFLLDSVLSDSNTLSSVNEDGQFNKSLDTCLTKNPKVSKEKVMAAIHSVFKDPVDQDVKCILYCIGSDMGEMNKDGVINVEKSLQNVPDNVNKDVVKAIEQECVTMKGANECDTAYIQFRCISEKALAKKDELLKKS